MFHLYLPSHYLLVCSSRFERDIEYMLNDKPSLYWKICWKFIAPLFIIVVFFASLIGMMVDGIGYQRWDYAEVGLRKLFAVISRQMQWINSHGL